MISTTSFTDKPQPPPLNAPNAANPPNAANTSNAANILNASAIANQLTIPGSMQSPRPVNPPTLRDAPAAGQSNVAHRIAPSTSGISYQAMTGPSQVSFFYLFFRISDGW